jgi:hypothetical protein
MNGVVKACIGVLLVVVLLGTYVYFSGKNEHAVSIARASVHLRSVYGNWIKESKPREIEPGQFIRSDGIDIILHTNTYEFEGHKIEGLVAAKSRKFKEPGYLIISQEGELYWIDQNERPRHIENAE